MNRIQNLINTGCLLIVSTVLFSSCHQENKISAEDLLLLKASVSETNANWQLFIDDYWVSSSENITSTLHQPKKNELNPLIHDDVPWEQNPYCFGTVIYDEEASVFKFWYQSYNDVDVSLQERTPILYATSKDGIEWNRPNLGLFEFQGSKDNNIVLQNYGYHDLYSPSIIKDASDPDPKKRYKMIWWDFPLGEESYQDEGMCVASSPDGIHWTKHPDNPILHANKTEKSISDVMSVMQDKNTGKFVAYTKGWADPWPSHRQIVRIESTDFIHWSEPEVVIRHAFDLKDPQSYGMTTSQFGNNYIGMMYSYKEPGNKTIDVQLVISHDNKNWQRVANQKTFIPLGKSGSWDDGMIFTAPLFNHKNKTLVYYSAWDNSHDSKERRRSGIGLASLRLNGFVSLDAKKNGSIITRIIRNAQGPLLVNVNAKEGALRAELLDVNGKPISGYTLNDCIPIRSNDVAGLIRWKNQVKLPDMVQFNIHFQIENASLYGFYAGKDAKRINFDFTQELSEDVDIVTIAKHLIKVNKEGGYTRSLALNYPNLINENAYKIQMEMLRQLENQGERLVGWKMGGANLDNFNPAFGFMLASDAHKSGESIKKINLSKEVH